MAALEEKHISILTRFLNAENWKLFGRVLPGIRLTEDDLIAIDSEEKVVNERCHAVLRKWYAQQTTPLLKEVLEAAIKAKVGAMEKKLREMLPGPGLIVPIVTPTPDDPKPPPPPPIITLRTIWWYKFFVNNLSTKVLKICLIILTIFWILEILGTATIARLLEHADSYPFKCHHSGFIFVLTTSLRTLTRCLFPLVLTLAFYYILKKRRRGRDLDSLMLELQRDDNSKVRRKFLHLRGEDHLVGRPIVESMTYIHTDLSEDLSAMCVTALLSGALLTLPMIALGATNFPASTSHIPGVKFMHFFDILAHFVRNTFTGLMLAFFFFEVKLKFLISNIARISDLQCGDREVDENAAAADSELCKQAEETVCELSYEWCFSEIFLHFASGLYVILLLASASSGDPFSCGISVKPDEYTPETAVHWFWFVTLMLFFHMISTCVFLASSVRPVGVILQMLGVLFLFGTFEKKAIFAQYLQVLYALIPMVYCFWFHLMTFCHECNFAMKLTRNRHSHMKRCAYSFFFIILIAVTMIAAIWNEYTNLSSTIGFPSSESNWPPIGKTLHERSCHSNGHLYKDVCMCDSNRAGSPCACLSQFF